MGRGRRGRRRGVVKYAQEEKRKEKRQRKERRINKLAEVLSSPHFFYRNAPCGCEIVPQLVICQKCGAVLYEGEELKAPSDIIESYDGKCPNCGKKLSYIPIDFEVKPVEETNQLSPLETEKKIPSRKKSRKKHKERLKKRAYASYEPKLGSIWNKESV